MWDYLHHCLIGIMTDKTIACADGVIEFLGLFGLVYVFANFGLESGMVFEGTMGAYMHEHLYHFNCK